MLQAAIILLLAVLKEIKLILLLSFKAAGLNVLHVMDSLSGFNLLVLFLYSYDPFGSG